MNINTKKYNKTKKVTLFLTNLLPNKLTTSRGFSFIELIVAVAIMTIVTSAVLFRQSKFSSDILITNMTYEVALAIRQAQVYGISSKQNTGCTPGDSSQLCSDTGKYKVGYGVHFGPIATGDTLNYYVDFIDIPTVSGVVGENTEFNYSYNNSLGDEYVGKSTLAQGKIKQYCAYVGSSPTCWPENNLDMDIVFVKPNPDAYIRMSNSGTPNGIVYDKAKLVIESALGDKCRMVTVYNSGQISVDPIDPSSTVGGCETL